MEDTYICLPLQRHFWLILFIKFQSWLLSEYVILIVVKDYQMTETPWCIRLPKFKAPPGRQMGSRQQNAIIICRSPIT